MLLTTVFLKRRYPEVATTVFAIKFVHAAPIDPYSDVKIK